MICYRRPRPIRAISFDLDDTLYDNGPVIRAAEQALRAHLHHHYPALARISETDWLAAKRQLLARQPELLHDVTGVRRQLLRYWLGRAGLSVGLAQAGAEQALALFLDWRNKVSVPAESHWLLSRLGQRYPLVAITNGNVDPHRIGLGRYFSAVFAAGERYRSKPYGDMFLAARQHLGLPAASILHVGDHLESDVYGALVSGQPAVWLNHRVRPLGGLRPRLLPHWEIHRLVRLIELV